MGGVESRVCETPMGLWGKPLISVGFRAEPCDGVTELRYTRYCYSLYHLCPTEEEVPPISFFSSTPLEKTVSLRELTDAPRKNPRKSEVLQLRPCFPAPLRMTGFFQALRAHCHNFTAGERQAFGTHSKQRRAAF